jgi:hypothetical protein
VKDHPFSESIHPVRLGMIGLASISSRFENSDRPPPIMTMPMEFQFRNNQGIAVIQNERNDRAFRGVLPISPHSHIKICILSGTTLPNTPHSLHLPQEFHDSYPPSLTGAV